MSKSCHTHRHTWAPWHVIQGYGQEDHLPNTERIILLRNGSHGNIWRCWGAAVLTILNKG